MTLLGPESRIRAWCGFVVEQGVQVRHRSHEQDDNIITLLLSDLAAGGGEVSIDMPVPVAAEIIVALKSAIKERRDKHLEQDSAACSSTG